MASLWYSFICLQRLQSLFGIKSSRFNHQVKSICDKRLLFEDRRLTSCIAVSLMPIFGVMWLQWASVLQAPTSIVLNVCVELRPSIRAIANTLLAHKQARRSRKRPSIEKMMSTTVIGDVEGGNGGHEPE